MELFDVVWVECPLCGTENPFQSKGGSCVLSEYQLDESPADVLSDVNRHPVNCRSCGASYRAFRDGFKGRIMDGEIVDVKCLQASGIPHSPRSVALYESIAKIDFEYGGDHFNFKSGGDGDNGEHLMYLLDIHFAAEGKRRRLNYRPCPGPACDGDCDDLSCDADK